MSCPSSDELHTASRTTMTRRPRPAPLPAHKHRSRIPRQSARPSRVGAVARLAWVRRKRNSVFCRRAKRHQRRAASAQPLEIQAFARRNAPARAVAPPHARHVVGTLGRTEAGENRSVGMMVRKRRRDRQDPCPSMASARDLRPKRSAAYPRRDGRCVPSGEEAVDNRPCHAQPSAALQPSPRGPGPLNADSAGA
jgi:hypothetical protein